MTLLCALTFTGRDGDLRTIFDGAPRCASTDEIPTAIAPVLARIRREGGSGVRLDVLDDLSGACVLRARIKPPAVNSNRTQ